MKKIAILITAALFALIICAAALANDTDAELYDHTMTLLFDEKNVSLKVNAELALDGTWFKTAEAVLKQDGSQSYRKLHLRSPKKDGTERENGYTIVTEGNDLFLMEDYTPGIYRTGVVSDRDSILRRSAATDQLISLGRVLASQADLLLGEGAVTRPADGGIHITLGENTPALANAMLNQAVMFAAKRYFTVDYDQLKPGYTYTSIYDYGTLTQGLLFCMRNVSVKQADITLKADAENWLQSAEGEISLYVETADDGVHQMSVKFTAEVFDRGSTRLKRFDPKDYQVELAADAFDYASGEEYQPGNDEALKDQMMLEAMKIWENTGFYMVATTSVTCEWDGNYYEVSFSGGTDGMKKTAYYNEEGEFRFLQAEPAEWMLTSEENVEYNLEPSLDAETDKKAQAFFMEFLENIHYNQIDQVKDLKLDWTFEKNGSLYASYEDKSDHGDGEGVNFVIRITPEMRIESFFREVNG